MQCAYHSPKTACTIAGPGTRQSDVRVAQPSSCCTIARYCSQTLEGVRMGHDSTVWALAFSASGSHLASVSEDQSLRVWQCDDRDGEPFYRFVCAVQGEHSRAVYSVSWGDDNLIATGSGAFNDEWPCLQHRRSPQPCRFALQWQQITRYLLAQCSSGMALAVRASG